MYFYESKQKSPFKFMKLNSIFKYLLLFSSLLMLSCSSDGTNRNFQEIVELSIEERLQNIINDKVGNDSDKLVGVSVSIRVGSEERWNLVGGI